MLCDCCHCYQRLSTQNEEDKVIVLSQNSMCVQETDFKKPLAGEMSQWLRALFACVMQCSLKEQTDKMDEYMYI